VQGLQTVVLYSLPELDGAIETIVLGGLVGDKIVVIPERVRKLCSRIEAWVKLRKTKERNRKIAMMVSIKMYTYAYAYRCTLQYR
jgi:magnesium chelatase subunit H